MNILAPFYLMVIVATGEGFVIHGGWDSCILAQQAFYPAETTCQQFANGRSIGPATTLPKEFRPHAKQD